MVSDCKVHSREDELSSKRCGEFKITDFEIVRLYVQAILAKNSVAFIRIT